MDTPEEVVRHRWAANRAKQTRRDVSDEAFEQIIAVMQPPTAEEYDLIFSHEDDPGAWIRKHPQLSL